MSKIVAMEGKCSLLYVLEKAPFVSLCGYCYRQVCYEGKWINLSQDGAREVKKFKHLLLCVCPDCFKEIKEELQLLREIKHKRS
jgi:hypothetical protein